MQRTAPPVRADHVGSLLRPAAVKEARPDISVGRSRPAPCVRSKTARSKNAIRKQGEIGLKLATDGELRCSWYQFDFLKGLDGVELYRVEEGITFHGVKAT